MLRYEETPNYREFEFILFSQNIKNKREENQQQLGNPLKIKDQDNVNSLI